MVFIIIAIVIVVLVFILIAWSDEKQKKYKMSPLELSEYEKKKRDNLEGFLHGAIVGSFICPFCQNTNCVRIKRIEKKTGISGGKATGALLTGGVSLLVTGLSKKEKVTEAYCSKCKQTWHF